MPETTLIPRPVAEIIEPGAQHWVGDGFFVHSVFHPGQRPADFSPFLLLDHAAPRAFAPSKQRRGVGEHPHRGFETVTFAYQGEIDHRDSSGGGGRIGPGDVQWMTAGAGLVHEEMHSHAFGERGGTLEMVQLWVNLPARDKMTPPRYQALAAQGFPRFTLGPAQVRLIAGELADHQGPAKTHTPVLVCELQFEADAELSLPVPEGFTALALTTAGLLHAGPQATAVPAEHLVRFARDKAGPLQLHGQPGTRALVLCGKPIDEPVASYGPFVMNTMDEIRQAVADFQSGAMGRL